MIFELDLVVPANTLATAPVRLDMLLDHGIVHRVEVGFPFGCNGKVLVVIRRALHQVWPTNPEGRLKANGFTISFPAWEELLAEPYQLEAYGWSPGTTYAHTIQIRLGVLPLEVLQPGREQGGVIRRLGEPLLGRG